MKNKNSSKRSVKVIVNINHGKVSRKTFDIHENAIIELPLSNETLTLRALILQQMATLDSLAHLKDVVKGEFEKDSVSVSAITSLITIIETKKYRDSLDLAGEIYSQYPEFEGYALCYDESITHKKLEKDGDASTTLKEVNRKIESIDAYIETNRNRSGASEAVLDAMMKMKNCDMSFSKKLEYAKIIVKSNEIMRKSDENPESCTKEDVEMLKSAVDVAEDLAKMMIDLKEGGIA
jgi:hypothetical protein